MAISHTSYTVTTSPTLIATIPAKNPTTTVTVTNDDNSSIFLGDITVSASGVNKGITVIKNLNYNMRDLYFNFF